MSEDRKEAQGRKPWLKRLAEGLMVLALAGMVIAVFVNVVLRYVFHTSIVSYEEISRLLFVWLVVSAPSWLLLKAPTWASTW